MNADRFCTRRNKGSGHLAAETRCVRCHKEIHHEPVYIVHIWQNALMPAPAFHYYDTECGQIAARISNLTIEPLMKRGDTLRAYNAKRQSAKRQNAKKGRN